MKSVLLGWRIWLWDGSTVTGRTWDDAVRVAAVHPDGVLVRMLYYEGGGKQIQQGTERFFVAPHPSGEPVYGAASDSVDEIRARYPGVILQRGKWAPDEFYRSVVDRALASAWDGHQAPLPTPCEGCP